MDCRNNPCDFAPDMHGQRTQGRCRCWDALSPITGAARREIRGALHDYRDRLRQAEAEVEKLRADVVWAVENDACLVSEGVSYDGPHVALEFKGPQRIKLYDDWSPESISSAVRRAREGE